MNKLSDIKLLSLSEYKLKNEKGLVLFRYGDDFSVNISLIFGIVPSQLVLLEKSKHFVERRISVYATLQFVYWQDDMKFTQTIDTFAFKLFDDIKTQDTLFKTELDFDVKSSNLPQDADIRRTAYFEIYVTWNTDESSDIRNYGFAFVLPSLETIKGVNDGN